MAAWINEMNAFQKAFAYIAVAGTIALVIQTVLLLIGVAHMTDADTSGTSGLDGHDFDAHDHDLDGHDFDVHDHDLSDHDHDFASHDPDHNHDHDAYDGGLRVFTLRGLVAFFSIMGWSGLIMLKSDVPSVLAVPVAALLGAVAMVLMAMAIRAMMRLQTSGNMDLRNALGRSAQVYLTIPPGRAGMGKITLTVQGQLIEVDAVTDSPEPIATGADVLITGINGLNTLVVEPME